MKQSVECDVIPSIKCMTAAEIDFKKILSPSLIYQQIIPTKPVLSGFTDKKTDTKYKTKKHTNIQIKAPGQAALNFILNNDKPSIEKTSATGSQQLADWRDE